MSDQPLEELTHGQLVTRCQRLADILAGRQRLMQQQLEAAVEARARHAARQALGEAIQYTQSLGGYAGPIITFRDRHYPPMGDQ